MKRYILICLILLGAGSAMAQINKVSDLAVTPALDGTIIWYDALTVGNVIAATSTLTTGNYYASQIVNGVESTNRLAVAVTVNALPAINLTVGGAGAISSGTGTNITVSNSVSGVNYQLFDGTSNVGSPVAGTGVATPINLPTGNLTALSTTFSVIAINATTSCFVTLTGTAVVTTN